MGNAASVHSPVQYKPPPWYGSGCERCKRRKTKCTLVDGMFPCDSCATSKSECIRSLKHRLGRKSHERMGREPPSPVEISPSEWKNTEGILRKNNGGKLPRPIKIDGKFFNPVRLVKEVKTRGGYEHMSKTEGAFTDLIKDLFFWEGRSTVKATNAAYRLKRYVKKYLLPHEEQSRTTVPTRKRKRSNDRFNSVLEQKQTHLSKLEKRCVEFLDQLDAVANHQHKIQRKIFKMRIDMLNKNIDGI